MSRPGLRTGSISCPATRGRSASSRSAIPSNVSSSTKPSRGAGRSRPRVGGITWLPSNVNERELLVYTDVDSWLVVSQSYHPDWRAYIDGAPASLVRVNLGLTGLRVPEGAHAVSLRYQSTDLAIGLLIASVEGALAVVVIIGELIVRHRWRRSGRMSGGRR